MSSPPQPHPTPLSESRPLSLSAPACHPDSEKNDDSASPLHILRIRPFTLTRSVT